MAKEIRSLRDKVVVITGAARGIGAATATELARRGARIAIGDLDLGLARTLAAQLGEGAYAAHLDVTDHQGFTAFLDEVERALGPIDVLVNNAGIMPLAPLDEESFETTARLIAINLTAVVHGTREAMQRMKPRGTGHIVNIASFAGKVGAAGGATYCATKHGVVGLCEAVYFELKGTGVEISCVMPTIVRTELASGLVESKLVGAVEPHDVAQAIAEVLETPRLEVFVPRRLGPTAKFSRLLPQRLGERVMRIGDSDKVLSAAAHSPARAQYEARAAARSPTGESHR